MLPGLSRCMACTLAIVAVACGKSEHDDSINPDAATGYGGSSGATPGVGGTAGATPAGGAGGAGDAGGAGGSSGSFACQDGGATNGGVRAAIESACTVAVVVVTRLDEECSGAGGTHVTLKVLEIGRGDAVTIVSHGEHAYWPPPEGPDLVGEYFVAGIDAFGAFVERPDNPAWCLIDLPPVDGRAHSLLAASSESDAIQKMQQILLEHEP